jgi:hypothetical protein
MELSRKFSQGTILTLLFCLFMQSVGVSPASPQSPELVGVYEWIMYLDGPFKGTTTITEENTSETITTSFGTYSDVLIVTFTDIKLEHSSKGYITISDSKSYYDNEGEHTIRMEMTMSFNVTGYLQTTSTVVNHYGDYQVVLSNDTYYEETYTRREYEGGSLEDTVAVREVQTLEGIESKTTDAGTFNCTRIKEMDYEDGWFDGYSLNWVSDDGKLVRQEQYDESYSLSAELTLISLSSTSGDDSTTAGFEFLIVALSISLILIRRRMG